MLSKRKKLLHELANHLAAVDGFLELEKPRQARLELKKAITCLRDLQAVWRDDEATARKLSA
jgi:hypothetical protein